MTDLNLTEQQMKDGCKKCIGNVQNLLDSAKLLLSNKNSHQYALGLYVYAIEEYGKAEILKRYLEENNSKYSIPIWVFGRGKDANKAHMRKLSEAFKKLSAICRKLSPVKEIVYNFSDVNQTFVRKKDNVESDSVSLTPYTSGIFEDTMIPRIKANFFDLKTACFYIDWDDDINSWRVIITADKDQLTYNIDRMKEFVSAFEV